jgi:hypothetical protein
LQFSSFVPVVKKAFVCVCVVCERDRAVAAFGLAQLEESIVAFLSDFTALWAEEVLAENRQVPMEVHRQRLTQQLLTPLQGEASPARGDERRLAPVL